MILYEGQNATEILDAVLASIEGGRHAYLVVPDRFSLEAETRMLDARPNGTAVDCEVTTLARLVDRLCDPERRKLSKEGAVMAIASLMHACDDALRCLKGRAFSGAAEEVYETIEQLIASDVLPEDLAATTSDPALDNKLSDLALVYRAYLDFVIGGDFGDAAHDVGVAARRVAGTRFIEESDFYLVGYDDLTRSNLRFVFELNRCAHSLTVGAVSGRYAFGGATLVEQLRPRASAIVRVPDTLSPLRRRIADEADDERTAPASYLERALPDERLEVVFASDRISGLERIARDVAEAVREGRRYRDYAVLTEDARETAEVLREYGVRVNADLPYALSRDPLARFLLAVTECATSRYRTETVRKLVMNPIAGIDAESAAVWDNYVVRFGISYTRHLSPYEPVPEDAPEERDVAERVRARIADLVGETAERLTRARTAGECVLALRGIFDRAQPVLREIRAGYPAAEQDFSSQAAERVAEILENLAYSSGVEIEADVFSKLFATGIESAEIRVTPTYADAVSVMSADSFGFRKYRRLYWFGADDGRLPGPQADCGLISDADIDRLAGFSAAIDPKIAEVNARARYRVFSTIFCAPELIAVVTTGQPNHFTRTLLQKYLATQTRAEEDGVIAEETLTRASGKAALRACATPAAARRTAFRLIELAQSRGEERLSPAATSLVFATGCDVSREPEPPIGRAHELFFGADRTSVSQLEQFFTCPYRHFLLYGLRCAERRVAQVRANDIGVFLHAVAEAFSAEDPDGPQACDDAAERIADGLFHKTTLLSLDAEHMQNARAALKREAKVLCRKLYEFGKHTDFRTESVEARFGEGMPAVRAGGVEMRGAIDRIDGWGKDVLIIDYKTGRTDYSLRDVYFGRQIQLFAYMNVLKTMGRTPAGALFFPITAEFGKKTACNGWVGADPDTIARLDRALDLSHPKSEILPVGLHKTRAQAGEWVLTNADAAFSPEDWDRWLDYTVRLAEGAVEDLDGGATESAPLRLGGGSLPCAYCSARSACRPEPRVRAHRETVKKDAIAPLCEETPTGDGREHGEV